MIFSRLFFPYISGYSYYGHVNFGLATSVEGIWETLAKLNVSYTLKLCVMLVSTGDKWLKRYCIINEAYKFEQTEKLILYLTSSAYHCHSTPALLPLQSELKIGLNSEMTLSALQRGREG